MDWDELPRLFPEFVMPARWLPLLQRHAALIAAAAGRVRVTAVEGDDVVARHYGESLAVAAAIAAHAPGANVLGDVGSGGGYPGIVLACVFPGATVHLIEPLQKRAALLRETAAALGLANVQVHPLRAEEAGRGLLREACAAVTARAVAALPVLLEYTAPLCRPGGLIVLPKGSALEAELAAAEPALATLGCRLEGVEAMPAALGTATRLALVRRTGALPPQYPRRPGVPARRPLSTPGGRGRQDIEMNEFA